MKNNEAMCKVSLCMLVFSNFSCEIFVGLFIQGSVLYISTHLECLSEFFYCFMSLNKSCAAIITIL